jgi:hypothetical protein
MKEPLWIWRGVSWCVGDRHANRISWMIRLYCRIAGVNPRRLQDVPPGYHL